ncbi:MAG: phosphate regulon sensor histidine kinase PhoR [Gammaproteobacteria bacterium]
MSACRREIIVILLVLLAATIAGALLGHIASLLVVAMASLLVRQLYQLQRLERWLRYGASSKYPKSSGIWEELYYHVYRIKKRSKRNKKKLSKMVNEFRESTSAIPDAAVVLGPHDEIEWINQAAVNVLGLQNSDKGQRIPNLIRHPNFVKFLKSGDYHHKVLIASPVNEQISLEIRVVAYGAGRRLLLAYDVTQLKKMERMRKDFVANVSHELRTPLTVLKGYLETLQDMDDGQSALISTSLGQMCEQTDRMQHLVDDLLLLARLETQQKKFRCVDMTALLTQICRDSGALAGAEQRVELLIDCTDNVYGDEQELRSAFTNLVVNALKYSPHESKVTVRWLKTATDVRLAVEDRGEGISAEDIPRITERFYRVDVQRSRRANGTGLGLAIVKHVLVRHDAKLEIRSELGSGSCFYCIFPLRMIC